MLMDQSVCGKIKNKKFVPPLLHPRINLKSDFKIFKNLKKWSFISFTHQNNLFIITIQIRERFIISEMTKSYPKMLTYLKFVNVLYSTLLCCHESVGEFVLNSDSFSFFLWCKKIMIAAESKSTDSVLSLHCNISEQKDNQTLVFQMFKDWVPA